MSMSHFALVFEALGHETRLKVFDFIYQSGEAGVRPKELIERYGFDSGTLDFHLKRLVSVGLIALKSEGRRGVYCVNNKIPQELARLLDAACAAEQSPTHDPVHLSIAKPEHLH